MSRHETALASGRNELPLKNPSCVVASRQANPRRKLLAITRGTRGEVMIVNHLLAEQ